MKEFVSQTGGRYTYIDDIMNLQELALAFANIFDGCDNFIISGCQVSGTTLSSGYVYLNGKIRYCAGLSGISTFPVHIYESNSVESVSYADSSDKIGRNVYGCAVASNVPTNKDVLTDALPQSISIASDGTALRLKDAFFGKYALMTDSPYSAQTVAKNVEFEDNITVDGTFTTKKQYVSNGTDIASISYDSGNLTILSMPSGSKAYSIVIDKDGKFKFVKNGMTIATIGADGIYAYVSVYSVNDGVVAGNIAVNRNSVYNTGDASDTGSLDINMVSCNGNQGYYRNTKIGNGKGVAILSITGSTQASVFNGTVTISNVDSYGLVLKHNGLAKTDATLQCSMAWKDKNNEAMGYVGYASNANSHLYLHNDVGDVVIDNDVHITGKLYVNDKEFTYDGPTETKDTGWQATTMPNCSLSTIYARQVGHVVSIQGQLHTHHSGTIFTLPNNIDPPKYEVGYSHNKSGNWHCVMLAGSRDCVVDYCSSGCSENVGFLLTYIV